MYTLEKEVWQLVEASRNACVDERKMCGTVKLQGAEVQKVNELLGVNKFPTVIEGSTDKTSVTCSAGCEILS